MNTILLVFLVFGSVNLFGQSAHMQSRTVLPAKILTATESKAEVKSDRKDSKIAATVLTATKIKAEVKSDRKTYKTESVMKTESIVDKKVITPESLTNANEIQSRGISKVVPKPVIQKTGNHSKKMNKPKSYRVEGKKKN